MKRVGGLRNVESTSTWGVLYVLLLGVLGLLWLEGRSTLTPFEHTLALLGIVLVFFALIAAWLAAANRKW